MTTGNDQQQLVEELVGKAPAAGIDLIGPGGLLATKTMLMALCS